MTYSKLLDYKIRNDLIILLESVIKIQNQYNRNVSKSRLVDIGLTIILSDEEKKSQIKEQLLQTKLDSTIPRSRSTFNIKNQIIEKTFNEFKTMDVKYIIEEAIKYMVESLQNGSPDDFKKVMNQYINAGGVLL